MDDFGILEIIRSEVQAEHSLISHRMTWYVTSQSFLMTAYAVSWGNGHLWPDFFHYAIPILGSLISFFTFVAVGCAVWAQWNVIKLQKTVLAGMKTRVGLAALNCSTSKNSDDEEPPNLLLFAGDDFLDAKGLLENENQMRRINQYSQIACIDRKTGVYTHALAMLSPIVIPILFLTTWIIAYNYSPEILPAMSAVKLGTH